MTTTTAPSISEALPTADTYPHRVPLALTPEQYERLRRLAFTTRAAGAELLRLAFDQIDDETLIRLAEGRTRNRRP